MEANKNNATISMVICTYNPNKAIFERVLTAIENLNKPVNLVEVIIVDNNSKKPIETEEYIARFLENNTPKTTLIKETKSGLTFARIAGIKASESDLVLFVDDDNVLNPDYVQNIIDLNSRYPFVGCWGPGIVNVDFLGEVPAWIESNKQIFQEKNNDYVKYGSLKGWHAYSPAGTGLVVKTNILKKYIQKVEDQELVAKDRSGKSLSSGGDSQIIHVATMMGYAVGMAPSLSLVHFISNDKANLNYIKKLLFMVNASITVHYEAFPELKNDLVRIPSTASFLSLFFYSLKKGKFKINSPGFMIPMASELGIIEGSYKILGIDKLPITFRIAKKITGLNDIS
ncbi:hypothetical protein DNU06_00230 [Putridiphycobacter roseus]|uniref:Glycosyltransferase 2-like domain-containing protein n=1 Tax=Putridiphycobacter roseus TaxID=2219161 RepID=A0A2W1N1Z2_9FLAO|nr:glycosyltransferase family 2 protein [Putridiphycobacter roseus]PZE18297.1 hypothetical protein DNU06_00230 [Putridiphycobacter roseus]